MTADTQARLRSLRGKRGAITRQLNNGWASCAVADNSFQCELCLAYDACPATGLVEERDALDAQIARLVRRGSDA